MPPAPAPPSTLRRISAFGIRRSTTRRRCCRTPTCAERSRSFWNTMPMSRASGGRSVMSRPWTRYAPRRRADESGAHPQGRRLAASRTSEERERTPPARSTRRAIRPRPAWPKLLEMPSNSTKDMARLPKAGGRRSEPGGPDGVPTRGGVSQTEDVVQPVRDLQLVGERRSSSRAPRTSPPRRRCSSTLYSAVVSAAVTDALEDWVRPAKESSPNASERRLSVRFNERGSPLLHPGRNGG